jgi:Tfp pilus assembly protein PilO
MNGEHWIILALIVLLAIVIIIAFGYNFFTDWKKRVIRLEKKNGYEQYQIDQLKAENKQLLELSFSLKKKVQELENKLAKYERN